MTARGVTAPSVTAPLVTVVIPAFNAERTIGETIASVAAQTYTSFEVIVVDDGSTDNTAAVVERTSGRNLELRLLRGPNAGQSTARNRAIAAARGELIAPLDADDVWHPEFLRLTVAAMVAAGPECGFVYALHRVIEANNQVESSIQAFGCQGRVFRQHLLANFVGNGSSALWRKAAMLSVGGYDVRADARGGGEDYLLQLRVAARYAVGFVPCYLVGYRKGGASLSSQPDIMLRSRLYVLEECSGADQSVREALRWSRAEAYRVAGFGNLKQGRVRPAMVQLSAGAIRDPLGFAWDVSLRVRNWVARRNSAPSSPIAFSSTSPDGPLVPCPSLLRRRLEVLRLRDDGI